MKNFAMDKIMGEEDEQKRKRDEEEMHRTLLRQAFFFFNDNTGHIDIIRNNQIEMQINSSVHIEKIQINFKATTVLNTKYSIF